ncbi:MAG: succinyldiaminopimelate transaminase [Cycloclasticus sp. symbiont of Bathymodiolus heckerae]|nr:MAG: succinyldiaminopimelate transaminase [Cycloclasticus sp. symbiont of Bathymodiolus heckerae]
MNPDLALLNPYPFEKLAQLKSCVSPPAHLKHIALSVGEPKHPTPKIITDALLNNLNTLGQYPTTRGLDALRESIAAWLCKRFSIQTNDINPHTHILPVSGTREALFSFAQCIVDKQQGSTVVVPNPFYQIYEGAALLAGAKPFFINCDESTNYLPDYDSVPADIWKKCQLLYICNPGNPSGAVHSSALLRQLIKLAHRYNFVIAADECYSEIYFKNSIKPTGLLQASAAMGNRDFARCVVFHSLSKRSNAPGLRSGFVAGDPGIINEYFRYRTYHGCTMPVPTQHASTAAWSDEQHVEDNRTLYQEKFTRVIDIVGNSLPLQFPDAGFYLWTKTPIADDLFTQKLFEQQHITVLPGQYLSRDTESGNPGKNHVRMALVASVEECEDAAHRLKKFADSL